jgi:hypothetical protein
MGGHQHPADDAAVSNGAATAASSTEAALQRCIGPSLVLKDCRTRVCIADDGASLRGGSRLRYRLRNRIPVQSAEVLRFRASPRSVRLMAAEDATERARLPI